MTARNDENTHVILSRKLSDFTDVTTECVPKGILPHKTHFVRQRCKQESSLRVGLESPTYNSRNTEEKEILNKQKSTQSNDCLIYKLFRMTCDGKEILRLKPQNDERITGSASDKAQSNVTDISPFTSHVSRKRAAFTLAEVLITLGIIGVVAAMTLPILTKKYQYYILENQFKKQYSVLQQALLKMQADEGQMITNNNYPPGSFAPKFFKQMRIILNCGSAGCEEMDFDSADGNYADLTSHVYKTYNKSSFATSGLFDDGQAMISDAAFIMINHSQAAQRITISVDINGYHKGPNIWGYDLFTFEILNDSGKLVPAGTKGTYWQNGLNNYCSLSSSNKYNGITCSYFALSDKKYWKNLQ